MAALDAYALLYPEACTARDTTKFEREYGSKERVEWIRKRPCVACGKNYGESENAHTETGGTGRKAGFWTIVPLCTICHRMQHIIGVKSFEARFGIDLRQMACYTQDCWTIYVEELIHEARNRRP